MSGSDMSNVNLSQADMAGAYLTGTNLAGADLSGADLQQTWIDSVDSIIVELHERMKPGCNRSFYVGSNGFDHEWSQGENVYLSRNSFPITRLA